MKRIQAKYTDNILDGRYEAYEDDKLIERGKYINGKKSGLWVQYYNNGNIKSQKYYINGKIDGICNYYDENGKLLMKGDI